MELCSPSVLGRQKSSTGNCYPVLPGKQHWELLSSAVREQHWELLSCAVREQHWELLSCAAREAALGTVILCCQGSSTGNCYPVLPGKQHWELLSSAVREQHWELLSSAVREQHWELLSCAARRATLGTVILCCQGSSTGNCYPVLPGKQHWELLSYAASRAALGTMFAVPSEEQHWGDCRLPPGRQ